MKVTGVLRNAFGNWKDHKNIQKEHSKMPDKYTENKLQVSYKATYLVNEAIRGTIQRKDSVKFNGEK